MSGATLDPPQVPAAQAFLEDGISAIDGVIVAGIMAVVLSIGIFSALRTNHIIGKNFWSNLCGKGEETSSAVVSTTNSEDGEKRWSGPDGQVAESGSAEGSYVTPQEFFLANRSMTWAYIGTSLFASNIGSEHFVGQTGEGAARGIAVAMYEWYASILLLLLGWVFAPLYARSGVNTTPEFFELRFNKYCRHYLSGLTCVMYILTKLSASIYGGSIILTAALGWNLYAAAGACVLLAALYTTAGGLRVVMVTDLFQTAIFLGGGAAVAAYTFGEIGGINSLRDRLDTLGKSDFWTLFKPADDDTYPWTGIWFGQPMTSLWYWCADMDIVQRVLASKDDVHTKGGTVMAAMLKILPPFLMVMPGIVAATLFDFDAEGAPPTDQAYSLLLTQVVPEGLRGVMIASILCAMMSSLDSVFNAGATIFTYDVYNVMFPEASQKTLTWVGRLSTVAFAGLSIAWIPILSQGGSFYRNVIEFQAYLTPPIGIVLLIGCSWKRANGAGGFAGLMFGGALGLVRLLVVLSLPKETLAGFTGFADLFFNMNFIHFALVIWVGAGIAMVVVSLLTAPPEPETEVCVIRWGEIFAKTEAEEKYPSWVRPLLLFLAGSCMAIMIGIWIYFR